MVKVSELPIYDKPDSSPPKPRPTPVTNIEQVVTTTLNDYVITPTKNFTDARCKDFSDFSSHIQTTKGMAQIGTLAVSVAFGRKLGQKALPIVKNTKYSMPFKLAHFTIFGSVPLAVICAWFETPREWTKYLISSGVKLTGSLIYQIGSWTTYFIGQILYFSWGAVVGIVKGVFSAIVWTSGSILNLFKSEPIEEAQEVVEISDESPKYVEIEIVEESPKISEESAELLVEKPTDIVPIEPEMVNPSEVELELASAKRHGEDEVLVTISDQSELSSKIEIEIDEGQSEEEDKDMFPSRDR